jgi:hypothetical protein
MFGIRYSYSDNYYATDGEDRGCSARDDSMAFNANQVRCSALRNKLKRKISQLDDE